MNIIIYTTCTEDYYNLGAAADHRLTEPASTSREWIKRAEYELPAGYSVAESNCSEMIIYNAAGNHCSLVDDRRSHVDGPAPILYDSDAKPKWAKLLKIKDLPW